jgi:putative hydrolase of the HAD superfamily
VRAEAVTFDFWNTLAYEAIGQLAELRLAALERLGLPVDRAGLERRLADLWQMHHESWKAGRHLAPDAAADLLAESLGDGLPEAGREAVREAFLTAGEGAELELTPGVAESLRALHADGIRLGIVCDVGLTGSSFLRAFLEREGLLELFDGWAFSDEVGHYKPSPVIFHHALARLSAPPERAVHVGDLKRTDMAGAKGVGMTAVRYRGVADDAAADGPEGDHVLDHHADFGALLQRIERTMRTA